MRSGTTWLNNLLNAHPDICCRGEMHALEIPDSGHNFPNSPTLESIANHLKTLEEWYFADNNSWNNPYRENKQHIKQEMMLDFVRFYFEWSILKFLESDNKPIPKIIGDKSPTKSIFHAEKLKMFFHPYNPLIVHIIRDPRSVAVSLWYHQRKLQSKGLPDSFLDDGDRQNYLKMINDPDYLQVNKNSFFYYPWFFESVMQHWLTVNENLFKNGKEFFGEKYILIKYEDLVNNTSEVLKSLLNKLDADVSDSVIDNMIKLADSIKQTDPQASMYRKGEVREWEKYLTDQNIEVFKKIALPFSREFGYI